MKWRKKSKSFYRKVFGYFLFMLFVPVLTILFLYFQTEKISKEQTLISSHSVLKQFFRATDIALEEMMNLNLAIVNNQECRNYALYSVFYKDKCAYQTKVVQEALSSLPMERYSDVFVYYPHDDRIISAYKSSISPDYYFDAYYDKSSIKQREQFKNILRCDSKKPKLYAVEQKDGTESLYMAMLKHSYNDERQNYVAVVMLSTEYLKGLLESEDIYSGGSMLIYDGDKNLLFSNSNQKIELPEGQIEEKTFYDVELGDSSFVMQVKQSEIIKGYYAITIPYPYFWKQLQTTRVIYGVGILLCCVIGIMISYRLCKRAYRPVGEMVDLLQGQTAVTYDKENNTEFEFIKEVFHQENEKNYDLKHKMKGYQDMVLERFLIMLLDGSVPEQSGENVFLKNGMTLYSDRFFVAVMKANHTEHDEMLPFILKNVFCEIFDQNHKGYVVSLSEGRFAILVNLRNANETEKDMGALLCHGKAFLKQYFGILLAIGTGEICEGMMTVPSAYKQALTAFRYKYLYGEDCLVRYKDIDKREFQYQTFTESKLFSMLISYITDADAKQTPSQFVEEMLRGYGIDEDASMETVDCFRLEIMSTMSKVVISRSYSIGERYARVEELSKKATLKEFMAALAELVETLQNKEREYEGGFNLCQRAREYILKNYGDPELSRASVGSKLGISAAYISKLFTDTYGISVPDFISQTRVRNAKEQLKNTEDSISEIAVKCGFLSSNVFIKTFKKWEGITPGVYKKLLTEAEEV